jgi:uncharacterized protein YecE (DUF72 family)
LETLPLFEQPSGFDRDRLRDRLAALAVQNIFIGTSSWKYEGWLGQIYSPDRYVARGKFSQKRFHDDCLSEYASTFPIVCGDFTFYQFPSEAYWKRLFGSAPSSLKYAFKAPEEITVKTFPVHPRYGSRAGDPNSYFLDSLLFQSTFLDLLEPYRERIAVLIFEFGTFSKQCYQDVEQFIAELDPFLSALPPSFRYGLEIRNREFLCPAYFSCLRRHGAAHVFNAWTRMPELREQMAIAEAYTADFTVTRALLRQGRSYENAVTKFSPYKEIKDPNPEVRQSLRSQISRAREKNEPSYIFVNNRLEGNAPQTIEAFVD